MPLSLSLCPCLCLWRRSIQYCYHKFLQRITVSCVSVVCVRARCGCAGVCRAKHQASTCKYFQTSSPTSNPFRPAPKASNPHARLAVVAGTVILHFLHKRRCTRPHTHARTPPTRPHTPPNRETLARERRATQKTRSIHLQLTSMRQQRIVTIRAATHRWPFLHIM